MFAQYTFINEQHKAAMTSVIHQQAHVTEPFLAELYRAALLVRTALSATRPSGIVANSIKEGELSLSTATDLATGIFVQLSSTGNKTMLTVGKKWAIQGYDPVTNTTQIKLL